MDIIKVSLTAENIKNLNSNPIAVLPAPGVGKGYLVHDLTAVLDFNTTPFDSGTNIGVSVDIADIGSRYKVVDIDVNFSTGLVAFGNAGSRPKFIENKELYLFGNQDSVAGDSTADVYIVYSVIEL